MLVASIQIEHRYRLSGGGVYEEQAEQVQQVMCSL